MRRRLRLLREHVDGEFLHTANSSSILLLQINPALYLQLDVANMAYIRAFPIQ